jgi:hypothetical protein
VRDLGVSKSALRALALLAALIAIAGLAAAPAPAATPGGPVDVELHARATDGYFATLTSEGDRLQLDLSRDLFEGVIYTFHGRVSSQGIHAKIGDLGAVDLRFTPTEKSRRVDPPEHCRGARATLTTGVFAGHLDLHAELGLTSLDSWRVKGQVATPGWQCQKTTFSQFVEEAPSNITYTLLQASAGGEGPSFDAYTGTDAEHPNPVGASISAALETHRGRVRVGHYATAFGHAGSFSFDSALTGATVDPPKPFSGSATYCSTCAPGSQWSGDLTVRLPGLARPTPLTGPAFTTTLQSLQGAGPERSTTEETSTTVEGGSSHRSASRGGSR